MSLVAWIILAYLSSLVFSLISLGSGNLDLLLQGRFSSAGSVKWLTSYSTMLTWTIWVVCLPGLILLTVAEVMAYALIRLELERDSLREEQALTV